MSEEEKYHTFPKKTMKLKDLLPLIRMSGYSNKDDGGKDIILSPECEEWTWAKFNENSCFLDLLGDIDVSSIDANEEDIQLWIEADDYNWFDIAKRKRNCMIDKQAAIDAILSETIFEAVDDLRKGINHSERENKWIGGILTAIEAIENMDEMN